MFLTVRQFRLILDRVIICSVPVSLHDMRRHWQLPEQFHDLSLLDKVTDSQGKILTEYAPSVKNQMTDVPSSVWDDIHDGMRRVVETHEQFNGLGVTLSGKTGTAELDMLPSEPWSVYRLYDFSINRCSRICACCPNCKWLQFRKCLFDRK